MRLAPGREIFNSTKEKLVNKNSKSYYVFLECLWCARHYIKFLTHFNPHKNAVRWKWDPWKTMSILSLKVTQWMLDDMWQQCWVESQTSNGYRVLWCHSHKYNLLKNALNWGSVPGIVYVKKSNQSPTGALAKCSVPRRGRLVLQVLFWNKIK